MNIEKLIRTTLADKQSIFGSSVFDSTLLDQPKVSPSPPFIAFSKYLNMLYPFIEFSFF